MINVREGLTGILYLASDAATRTFVPNYDQDQARGLLSEFQKLEDESGRLLKTNYHVEGYNWYPSMVSWLYWYVFFPFVKYELLILEWIEENLQFSWEAPGQFRTLLDVLGNVSERQTLASRLHALLVRLNNRVAMRQSSANMLFFRFAQSDFRTAEIRKALDSLGTNYLDVSPAPRIRQIVSDLVKGKLNYYYAQPPGMNRGNRFGFRYRLDHLEPIKRLLFTAAIRAVELSITSFVGEYQIHKKALAQCHAETFYGLDDINGYVFPVLYACRSLGLRTIGHQHGAYVRRHAGYMMDGIDAAELKWFERVIVWGEYWKEKMERSCKAYPPDFFVVGCNKLATMPQGVASLENRIRTVLIPYEFLGNTAAIGKYMQKLMDLGYQVAFKPRPDDDLNEQLTAYCLPDSYRSRLKMISKLDAVALGEIDIVAGTMTTLIYELLPCNKIIWVLETEFRHLFDLVEEGMAHLIRLDDLLPPEQMPPAKMTRTCVPSERLFGTESLIDTLRKQVLRPSAEALPLLP